MVQPAGGVVDSKYQILRQLGQGGMGAVYEAQHRGTGRRVALKVIVSAALANEPDVVKRFQREARASGSIESQHVVQVLDTGVDPSTGSPYMVMELLSGEDVHDLSARLGPLHPDLVLRLMAQACTGLERAHDKGIVHRDIKSANMFLSRREGNERVLKLLDFGIAKVRADQLSASDNHGLTRTGSMLGSPLYMSPEQARGAKDLDGRSDLFSLGVVMYEALVGKPPNGECQTLGQLILAICSEEAEHIQNRAAWVPPEVAAIVHRALATNPAQRFESAEAMHAAIGALLPHGESIHERMLVGVSPELRAYVAPRYEPVPVAPPSGMALGSPLAASVVASSPSGAIQNTTTGVGRSAAVTDIPVAKSSASRWLVPLGVAVVAVVGLGAAGFKLAPRLGRAPPVAVMDPSSIVASTPSSPSATVSAAASAPAVRTVLLAIAAPTSAKVEVDGRPVDLKDGNVELRGQIGSVHAVRVVAAGRETRTDVLVQETGAFPPRVELVIPRSGAAAAGPAIAPANTPAGSPSALVKSAATPVPPPVSKPAEATQPAGAPTINKQF